MAYVNFTKVELIGNWFPQKSANFYSERCQEIMASLAEVRFIDESDFVNKGNGFILRDCSDWELDSTIPLELTDLPDDISISLGGIEVRGQRS